MARERDTESFLPAQTLGSCKKILQRIFKPIYASVICVFYFSLGCAFYYSVEGWSMTTAIYFQIVTVSTVGYGDLTPSTDASRVFTVFWILIGIIFIFTFLADAVLFFTQPLINGVRRLFERMCPPRGYDINGDGTYDFHYPRHPLIHYPKELLPPFFFALTVQLVAAAVFVYVEGWSYGIAFYHCMVTATTVGYGDIPITSRAGQIVAVVHILVSVSLIAMFITEVSSAVERRRLAIKKLGLVRAKLDPGLIESLDKDGNGVDKLEFVIGMVIKLGLIEWSEVEPFIKQFEKLDEDGSGHLDKDDLRKAAMQASSTEQNLSKLLGRARTQSLKLQQYSAMADWMPAFLFGGRGSSKSQPRQDPEYGAQLAEATAGGGGQAGPRPPPGPKQGPSFTNHI